MKKIIGFGELLWDCLPEGRQIGGAPANFAFHVTQCGENGVVVSAVGKDAEGEELLARADELGLKCVCARAAQPTGHVEVCLDGEGVPQYEICREVAWDYIPFTPRLERLAIEADAVCFGTLAQRCRETRATLKRFLNLMRAGTLKVFDINLRQDFYSKEILAESLHVADILKLNNDEIAIVRDMFRYEKADFKDLGPQLLRDFNLKALVLTCGAKGSYVFSPGKTSFKETRGVAVADTVGAGDAFTAAFVASFLQGKSVEECHARAVSLAAYVCTRKGAMPPLTDALKKELGFG